MVPVLVTGAAGFIGYHLSQRLLGDGHQVVGFDNVNDYYSVALKRARLHELLAHPNFRFIEADLSDLGALKAAFDAHKFSLIYHLAAQAGVRYSLVNPHAYVRSNIDGFVNLLECCRHHRAAHLVFASSSSVYGAVTKMPFSVHQNVDHPLSLYAATKKSNELLAHAYSHLFQIPTTGLRFFTVYGPWGRPDMAVYSFTRAAFAGEPIDVYGEGEMLRDFTYIDDVIEALVRIGPKAPLPDASWNGDAPDPGSSSAPYKLYNIGNHAPEKVSRLIELIEQASGKTITRRYLPIQPGDVPATYADVSDLTRDVGFSPSTPLDVGVGRFVDWYRAYSARGA